MQEADGALPGCSPELPGWEGKDCGRVRTVCPRCPRLPVSCPEGGREDVLHRVMMLCASVVAETGVRLLT